LPIKTSLQSGCFEIPQIGKAFNLRQRRLQLAGFGNDLNYLGKALDLGLLETNVAAVDSGGEVG
jgi:hypothetical protein